MRLRILAVLMVAVVASLTLDVGSAATLEARWSLFARAGSSSFLAGTSAIAPGTGQEGYEIVGFGAAGPSAGLASFSYGGADVPASQGGPVPPIVTCDADFTLTAMNIGVQGAYPYAGCIFFLGVSNTGDLPIQVDLGSLGALPTVTCNAPGCSRADIDIVAGGPDLATIAAVCRTDNGTVGHLSGLRFAVPPGATFVCPLFVTVLQSASEGTTYLVTIDPPPIEEPQPIVEDTPTSVPPVIHNVPVPTIVPSPPVRTSATPTPTKVDVIAGEKTPGTSATPIAPATGTGTLVQRETRGGGNGLVGLIVLVLAAGALIFAVPANRRR